VEEEGMNMNVGQNVTYIGIDPGVNTGYAIVQEGAYVDIGSDDILTVMDMVRVMALECIITVIIENPNKWKNPAYLKGYAKDTGRLMGQVV
jgi:hypothetical protein